MNSSLSSYAIIPSHSVSVVDEPLIIEAPEGDYVMSGVTFEQCEWRPVCREQFSYLDGNEETTREGDKLANVARSGNLFAVYRPGYWHAPFGAVTDIYKPLAHNDSARVVLAMNVASVAGLAAEASPGASDDATQVFEDAAIEAGFDTGLDSDPTEEAAVQLAECWMDGHGRRVGHNFTIPRLVASRIAPTRSLTTHLSMVHDHTGGGSVRVSAVCYVGGKVIGASIADRKLHVGQGQKNVGAGSQEQWMKTIAHVVAQAVRAQEEVAALVARAMVTPMDAAAAETFDAHGITVVSKEETDLMAGEKITVYEATNLLDAVMAHYEPRTGALRWGVWSRRLTSDAITALDEILNPIDSRARCIRTRKPMSALQLAIRG
jgi:hypothetical protein